MKQISINKFPSRNEHIINNHDIDFMFATTSQQGMMKWEDIEESCEMLIIPPKILY